MNAVREDSYRAPAKHPDPAACPSCHATYVEGRWTWQPAPKDAARLTCPACARIADGQPAGYVRLEGPFFVAHRDEIMPLVSARAQRARDEHPLQRVIGVENVKGGVVVTTTDAHLARGIAVAVHDAYKGDLDIDFAEDENLVRARWKR